MQFQYFLLLFSLLTTSIFCMFPCNDPEKNCPTINRRSINNNDRIGFDMIQAKNSNYKSPLLIFLHGGAWVADDSEISRQMGIELAEKYNISTALVYYRLSQKDGKNEIKHPRHIKDAINGFTNITSFLNQYNIDSERIYLGGHSAGAHLAALLALDAAEFLPEVRSDKADILKLISKVKGIISIGGIFDLEKLAKFNKNYISSFIVPAFGVNSITKTSSTWKEASPQYIQKKQLEKIPYPSLPKYLLFHSTEDNLVEVDQTLNFVTHLRQLGINNIQVLKGSFGNHNVIPINKEVESSINEFIRL